MGTKAERRAARERVSAYHQAQLAELLSHVGTAIDRYRTGEIDAYAVDETIHHYHQAAAELSALKSGWARVPVLLWDRCRICGPQAPPWAWAAWPAPTPAPGFNPGYQIPRSAALPTFSSSPSVRYLWSGL